MAGFNKFDSFLEDVHEGKHDAASDTYKVMLTNVAPLRTNSVTADLTEIAAANGYTAGGAVAAVVSSAQTNGTYKLVLANVEFIATGGNFGPFRYAVLRNSTTAEGRLVGWWDYGQSITQTPSQAPFVVSFSQTAGVLTNA